MATKLTGAQALIKALEREGVTTVFGVPGGAILPAYDPLLDSPIRHILARHEQGAGHMASGYAWATGEVGVCIATSGPGATNLVTPLADALIDSVPMVAITGQVAATSIGMDAFQEAHTTGITMGATKHNYLITDAETIPDVVHEAFHIAKTGRPGPVLIDVPKDMLNATVTWRDPAPLDLPGYKPTTNPHPRRISQAIKLLQSAKQPMLYLGGGIIHAGAATEAFEFANKANLPTVTSLMGRGSIPDSSPLALGMSGMHGTYAATTAFQKADVILGIGVRWDDRVTGNPEFFAPNAKIIHADIDPAEIGKVVETEIPIVGDAKAVLTALNEEWGDDPTPARTDWMTIVEGWKETFPLSYDQQPDGMIKQQFVIEELHRITGGDAIIVSGVGQHQMWASQFWKFEDPNKWINSGGLGTMGYAVPAAIGAKAGKPDELVYAIDGDGCFQMTFQEMITAAVDKIPVKIAVMNNGSYGMVAQWQKLFYEGRMSSSILGADILDYVKLAEAMGCVGLRATTMAEVAPVIQQSLEINDRPVIVEFLVDPDEMVFPMVVAGGNNDEVIMTMEDLA
jgi:acetolactate synthase-1/2/3 large subunit